MIKAENQKKRKPFTAQDTIPYKEIYKDGICRTDDNYYSKMVQFYDINYQLAQNDDKAAIFENYCEFLMKNGEMWLTLITFVVVILATIQKLYYLSDEGYEELQKTVEIYKADLEVDGE